MRKIFRREKDEKMNDMQCFVVKKNWNTQAKSCGEDEFNTKGGLEEGWPAGGAL